MSDVAIRVEGLGKRYRIGERKAAYNTLRDSLSGAFTGSLRGLRRAFSPNGHGNGDRPDHFWALKDVSFEIKHGEVVGVIGRNGAGKSTLLKVLSRITEPTTGRARVHGRVGSLLEVGTGFHPELTGRENIYLNGAILGMTKAEIARKFDEIVAFAEVEKFLDTPVKRYSSGMQLRLGFSVAAHLEPDILIVDEVLAVGDAAFQKKCLGMITDVARQSRTVLFVSHNMAAVKSLCTSAFLLADNTLRKQGLPASIIAQHLAAQHGAVRQRLSLRKDRNGTGRLRMTDVNFSVPSTGDCITGPQVGEPLVVAITYKIAGEVPARGVEFGIDVRSELDDRVVNLSNIWTGQRLDLPPSHGVVFCSVPRLSLLAGTYFVDLFASVGGQMADFVRDAAVLRITPGDYYQTGKIPPFGYICLDHRWSSEVSNHKTGAPPYPDAIRSA